MAKVKTSKKSKSTKAKTAKTDAISLKQYGRNIVMIVDGEKYSRAFNDKKEREAIKAEVEKYNSRNSKKRKDSILNTMLEFEKEKETKAEKVKEAKKTLKKEEKVEKPKATSTEDEVAKAKQLLENHNYVVSKPAPRRRGGEY